MNVFFRPMYPPTDWQYIDDKCALTYTSDTKGMTAQDSDTGDILAVTVFQNWTANAVTHHGCINNQIVLKHGWIEEVAHYVFETCEKNVLFTQVASDNNTALLFDKSAGFIEVARLKDYCKAGVDLVLFEMRKENCKWLAQEAAA